ncbi:MAG: hypothetical protein Fur0018_17650 [Anaerolineales bacterium]
MSQETSGGHVRRSFVGRFSFALMMGVALAWVLLRRRSAALPANEDLACSPAKVASREIEITVPAVGEPSAPPPAAETAHERLERIRGIGPKFAERLHQAGIHTFAALAAQSPERLLEIVQAQSWQKVSPEAWIVEARMLSADAPATG